MKKEMLSGEVAHLLRVHPISITRWSEEGKLKYRKNLHGWKVFDSDEVERFRVEREKLANDKHR